MNNESKITAGHLGRAAYLYIRQSSLHQALENTESTQRQYALRRRAVALGWPDDKVVVIDRDQGQSGASASEREGFQRLVADVGLGKAGIVMGLEVSRLARNCADWHRLLEICAISGTLILDEDGLYDPAHYNDRLLLGLKGTMSEAELHILRARLLGGVHNKARRGELRIPLPVGLSYDPLGRVELDPDQQVRRSMQVFFATFAREGSAWSTVRAMRAQGLKFPAHGQAGSGDITWQHLTHATAVQTLHNPRYAGAFCFGRTRRWKDAGGKSHTRELPRDQWRFLKLDAHPGYITWEQFLENEKRLCENRQAHGGGARPAGPPREGPALLQGLVLCGKCGRGMSVRYHRRGESLAPDYVCQKKCVEETGPVCQHIPGGGIDTAVGELLVASVTPLALEASLAVHSEIQARLDEASQLRAQHVQRAQYEADQARLRYMRVDPDNRLVADSLEANWNEKLRLLATAKQECSARQQLDSAKLTEEQAARIRALGAEFPRLWSDPKTACRDRKRIARLLIEDVTLHRGEDIAINVRFKGGATRQLHIPLSKTAWALRTTAPQIIAEIDRLLDEHTAGQIVHLLNERGWRTGCGGTFTVDTVKRLRRDHGLQSRAQRLRERGWLTPAEVGALLGCRASQVNHWRQIGLLTSICFDERGDYLYQKPSDKTVAQIRARQRPGNWKPRNPQPHTSGAV